MSPFRTITQKYFFLVGVTLLPTLILLGVSYRFTHHLQENVKVMEAARTQKMLIYELSWQLNMAAVGNHSSPNEHLLLVRNKLLPEISNNIGKLSSSICAKSFCYSHHEILLKIVNERKRHWRDYMYPLLNRIFSELNGVEVVEPSAVESDMQGSSDNGMGNQVHSGHHGHESPANEASLGHEEHFPGWSDNGSALDEYNLHIHSHLAQVNELIRIMGDLTNGEQLWFERIRLVFILSVLILLAVFTHWIRHSLVIPLVAVSRAVSEVAKGNYAVNLNLCSKDELEDIAINFNKMTATVTRTVVDNKKLLREASRKQEELTLLNRVSKGISGFVSFEEFLDYLVGEIRKISFFYFEERACLFLVDKDGERVRYATSRSQDGWSDETDPRDEEGWEKLCMEAVRRRKIMVSCIDDVTGSDSGGGELGQKESGYIALPFFAKNELLGVLCLFHGPFVGEFPALVRELLSALTELVAISVGTILTFQHMKKVASFPEKTPNPIVEFNQDLEVVYVNPAARKICHDLSIEPRKLLPERLFFNEVVEEEPMRAMTSWEHRVGGRVFDEYIHLFGGESIRLYAFDVTGRREMENALRESEERFRAIVESSTDWIWEVDDAGVYAYTSPRVKDLLGYSPAEMIGRSIFPFIAPAEAQKAEELFRSHAAERAPFSMQENCFIGKDGTLVVLETSGIPIHIDGKFCGYRGISRDITDRKKSMEELLASEARFRTLLDVAPIGILIIDLQGSIIEANRSALHLFGYENKEQLCACPVAA
ncbi:MAG: PAS domain S-box protein, partial [Desulfobulbaceae bacterium]|nr:PAS domain S-box protein [Desulfobulbaceae bacterium]